MNKTEIEKQRKEIAKTIEREIRSQNIAIEEIERQSVSKRIIYNIIQGKGYTIDSLIQVTNVLKKNNTSFKINV